MQLNIIDIGIILCYFAATIGIGLFISKRASKNLDSYFLGERGLPWYILGISNASGMFDITGTMWLVYILFVYGLKSAWLPWIWPIFNQIFLMIYLSSWMRKSNVMTGAEWIKTRFGTGKGSNLSHISVVIFAMVSVIGFLAYDFQGVGKFAKMFLPWDLSANFYAIALMLITAFYVISGGMLSVVFTEILQFAIMTVASIAVAIIAMSKVSPDMLAKVIPDGWRSLFFGWHLNLDWSGIMDSVNSKIATDGYELFTIFFIMMMFKGILISMAGPAPNYDMQRILATKSPREASLMSGFVNVILLMPRYLMIAGFTILALAFYSPTLKAMGSNIDFEMVLPYAIKNFMPIGILGIVLAGLLSAFMSTFAATINAAPAYLINDIYKRYINPNADNKKLVLYSKLASVLVLVVGMVFGYFAQSINQVTLWIVSALWGGYAAPNILKWYWWRFNGYGYFWGMISGILAAMAIPKMFPTLSAINSFPFILIISTFGSILATFLTKPEDDKVLKAFYKQVRPWGFWGPIHDKVIKEDPGFQRNKNFKRDMFNILIGLVWQIALIATPIYVVIRQFDAVAVGLIAVAITSWILKKNWYDKLDKE